MCGIAGFTHDYPTDTARAKLNGMLNLIQHRGPNDKSGVVTRKFALGNVRLSIIDIDGGQQPAYSKNNNVIIVFNGEIFNYRELREELKSEGVYFETNSEIEVLLQLYLKYGKALPLKLNGQFAIAICDLRDNSLFLIRDPFGIRPLFWTKDRKNNFAFASEIKSLRYFLEKPLSINAKSLVHSINFWTIIGDETAFNEINQIPPGYTLEIKNGLIKLNKYWELPNTSHTEKLILKNESEYLERFTYELKKTIVRQSLSDVEIGSYVSGGLDSSILSYCLAEEKGSANLKTFSLAFSDKEYDESVYQDQLVKCLGVSNETVRVNHKDIADIFPTIVSHAETFLFRTAPAPLYFLSKKVRESGINVVMTGEGADEILLGYDIFRETKIRRFWARQPESKWRGELIKSLYNYLPQFQNPRYSKMSLDFYKSSLMSSSVFFPMEVRWQNSKKIESFLSHEIKNLSSSNEPTADLLNFLPTEFQSFSDVDKIQQIEVSCLLSNYLLSSQGDRMTMAHGVEGRYPYLDTDFVKFCSSLPEKMKLLGLKDKYILRKSFKKVLPSDLIKRKKFAYQAPEMKAFFKNGKLVDYAAELMSEKNILGIGLFNPSYTSKLIKHGETSGDSRLGFSENMAFILILSTCLLHEQFCKDEIIFKNVDLYSSTKIKILGI